jgi:hypothetical protein
MGSLCVCLCISLMSPIPTDDPAKGRDLDGLWTGSWGGGERGGVVFQPVLAELFIHGNQVELAGFPAFDRLAGNVHVDPATKQLRITHKDGPNGKQPIEIRYELRGDALTLTDSNQRSTILHRLVTPRQPFADARAVLVTSGGINEAGQLVMTEYSLLQAGREGATYYRPGFQSRSLKDAVIYRVGEKELHKLTVEDAGRAARNGTPIVVAYRLETGAVPVQFHRLWKDVGPPQPDSAAVGQTFLRLLRPGTLVFILTASESVPRP